MRGIGSRTESSRGAADRALLRALRGAVLVICAALLGVAGGGGCSGGAIHASYFSHFTLEDSLFERNEADELGGAVFDAHQSDPRIEGSTFRENSVRSASGDPHGGRGGAIALIGRTAPVILRSVFERNRAATSGGAVSCDQLERPTALGTLAILDSTIDGNSSFPGSASLYFARYAEVELRRCRITGHEGRAIEARSRDRDLLVVASHNWWGTAVRESIVAAIADRSGGAGTVRVEFEPFELSP